MALLTIKDLSLGYDSCRIIENLNFTVDKGDYLSIVGENGSGKTTLMKTILKLQKPIAGEIIVSNDLKANEIGYLPQQTIIQRDFPASVKEIVLSGCLSRMGLRPFYGKKEKMIAEENMCKMGILDLKNRCYRELSGGQQQRVLLARTLCASRKLLLLDEPVAGLDPQATLEMYETIEDLNKSGITIIMVSHDIGAALSYSSHILHIGKDVFFGIKSDYLKSAQGRRFAGKEAVYA
ncbi:MAG: metal ABC transporter ATP-binding protein [Butyrivibrio sp.]|nr:metal ABC transporter ATP-binding protein [Butyrivibrio sp.]